jgi:long-chain acyl-CoA synthetase
VTRPFFPEILDLHGRWLAAKTAIIAPDATLSWRDFNEDTNRVANGLIAAHCAKGARVGVIMNNSASTVTAMLGIIKAGAIAVPLNTSVMDEAIDTMLADCGATAIVASAEHAHRLTRAALQRSALCLIDGAETELSSWKRLDQWRAAQSSAAPTARIDRDDVCNIIYSSGTTGQPKGITHTHGARIDWAQDLAHALRYDSAARTLVATGLYSNISWASMLCTLLLGGTLVVLKKFDAGDVLKAIARERISHTSMVPLQYQLILEDPAFAKTDTSSMRAMMCCGSALPERVKVQLFEHFACGVIELYGSTEGVITTLAPEDAPGRIASVGKPLPGEDLQILDDENQAVRGGAAGEIVALARFAMNGYWGNPSATEEAFWIDAAGRRWLRTGDIGRLDAEGYLYITDRKKDVIISGGQNVFPADIEAVLMRHPDVAECAVIGIPSDRWGETPLALLVMRAGAEVIEADLLRWANAQLGKQQRLHAIERRMSLPRNANGKVLKRELRTAYWPQTKKAAP